MKLAQSEVEEFENSATPTDYQVDNQVTVPINESFLLTAQFWILVFCLVGMGVAIYVLISKKRQRQQREDVDAFHSGQVHDERLGEVEKSNQPE